MYRTEEQVGWDNRNTANFAGGKKEGREEGAFDEKRAIAKNLRIKSFDLEIIADATGLSIEEIEAL